MAQEAGLDLVEVAPNEKPPVCRIMDYGRFKYTQKRHKQKHREQKLKEIRLHPDIGDHDRQIKLNQAIGFLQKGDKVQFTMLFRGREMMHVEHGYEIMDEIVEQLAEKGKLERKAQMLGRRMNMIMAPETPQHG